MICAEYLSHCLLRIKPFDIVGHILSIRYKSDGCIRIKLHIQQIAPEIRLIQLRKDKLILRNLMISGNNIHQVTIFCGGGKYQKGLAVPRFLHGSEKLLHVLKLSFILMGMTRRIHENIVEIAEFLYGLPCLILRINNPERNLQDIGIGAKLLHRRNPTEVRPFSSPPRHSCWQFWRWW